VGVALYPTDARELSALIDCADAALYAAKRAGRNAVRAHAEGMREHPGRERDVSITADVEPPAR
jgi:predicted signal transduction protein with EAL and GGDEF domain